MYVRTKKPKRQILGFNSDFCTFSSDFVFQSEKNNFWGFHIHENGNCDEGDLEDPFKNAGEHFTMEDELHPNHTGDLPMIYSNNGYSFMIYYSDRFKPDDVIGKSVIIHKNFDDITTQPSGNSGKRIACGVIVKEIK